MCSSHWFVGGGLRVTRPMYRNFSAGLALWGAAQPGLYPRGRWTA
jgi:hypothetical protein